MKSEKELYDIWKKYIDRPIYRVVPLRDYRKIRKQGINPKKNPFEKIKPNLNKLFNIILRLERKGFVMKFKWGDKMATGKYAVDIFRNDLKTNFVDFGAKEMVKSYMGIEGGALTRNIRRLTKRLIENKPALTKKEEKVIRELDKWAIKNICKNKMIYVKGSSKSFETAKFHLLGKDKRKIKTSMRVQYLPSPFGSFEHFKKIIKKQGIRKYIPRLKNEKFYLRVKSKISAKEIRGVK